MESMIETAHEILLNQSEPVPFINLYNQVSEKLGFTPAQHDDNIAHFFSDLSLDNRFISRPKNSWDLKKRHSTQDKKIDLEALSLEDEDEELEVEEMEDEVLDEDADEDGFEESDEELIDEDEDED